MKRHYLRMRMTYAALVAILIFERQAQALDWQEAIVRFVVPCAFGVLASQELKGNHTTRDFACVGVTIGANLNQGSNNFVFGSTSGSSRYDLEKELEEAESRPALPGF